MKKSKLDKLFRLTNSRYPIAGGTIGDLEIRGGIDNFGSIDASLLDYRILPGICEVPTGDFDAKPTDMYCSVSDLNRVRELALEISLSGWISPLIVVVDDDPDPYILEGGHRLGALYLLGIKTFPALVVVGE